MKKRSVENVEMMEQEQEGAFDSGNSSKVVAIDDQGKPAALPTENMDAEMGEFEDPWEDEFSDEEMLMENEDDDEDDEDMVEMEDDDEKSEQPNQEGTSSSGKKKKKTETKLYLPGIPLEEGEELDFDASAYDMFHQMNVEWPCLSFDVVTDELGACREKYPMTCFLATGTQADHPSKNKFMLMKIDSVCRTKHDDDSIVSSDDEDEDSDPILSVRELKTNYGFNRVRCMPQWTRETRLVASMNDNATLSVFSIEKSMASLESNNLAHVAPELVWTSPKGALKDEGFALDWSLLQPGRLLSGDCSGTILETLVTPDRVCTMMRKSGYLGHTSSVEDIQWSPSEPNVFASASADGTIRLWDARESTSSRSPLKSCKISDVDVNVISWNRKVNYLMAAGLDDGSFQVLDLRMIVQPANSSFHTCEPIAKFNWHKSPITSIEWHPTDESVLAMTGADNQLTIWDLSLERDTEAILKNSNDESNLDADDENLEIPPQLLCIHQGQEDMKELHFHPQLKHVVMSTALTGFHIFKSISLLDQ